MWESVLVGFVPQDDDRAGMDLVEAVGSVRDPSAACRHRDAGDGFVARVPVGAGTDWPDATSPGGVLRDVAGIVADAAIRIGAMVASAHAARGDEATLGRSVALGILRHLPVGDVMPVAARAHANDDYHPDPAMAGNDADVGQVRLYVAVRAARRSGPLMHRDVAARLARADAEAVRATDRSRGGLSRWVPRPSFLASLPAASAFDGRLVPDLVSFVVGGDPAGRPAATA